MKSQNPNNTLGDWLFERLIRILCGNTWTIETRHFHKGNSLEKPDEKCIVCEVDTTEHLLVINPVRATPKDLLHEFGHILFDGDTENILYDEACEKWQRQYEYDKREDWIELKVQEFAEIFFETLSPEQLKILEDFLEDLRP